MEATKSESLEARVENIERMLGRIESQLAELPNLVAAGVDTVDGLARDARERGVDIDERLQKAASLVERLTDPATARTIDKGIDLANNLSPGAAAAADTIDGLVRDAQRRGVDIDQRLRSLFDLADLFSRPAVARAVTWSVEALEQAPGLAAMAVDSFDKIVLDMQERGVEVCDGVDSIGRLLEMLIKPEFLQSVTTLIDVATPRALETTELIASAMVDASDEPPTKIGPLGLVRAMGKGNGKLVLGFTANLVQNLGERLSKRSEDSKLLEDGER